MVALYHRPQTGEGQIVDGSLLATGITFVQGLLAERSVLGIERRQTGNTGYYAAPADAYQTQDGWIVVSAVGNEMFARWARLVGREDFIGDPRFAGDQLRADNREAITEAMNAWLASRTTEQAIASWKRARSCRAGARSGPGAGRSAGESAGVVALRRPSGRGEAGAAGEYGGALVSHAGQHSQASRGAGRAHG